MWTQQIIDIVKDKTSFNFTVEFFKDGTHVSNFTFERVSDPNSVKQLIRNQLAQLQKVDELDLKLGDIDLTLPSPDPVVPPTQDELDKQEYQLDVQKLNQLNKAVSLGLVKKTDKVFTDTETKVKDNYQEDYLSTLSGILIL